MPPELSINPTTGFLDRSSINSFSTFSSDKKLKFLELADEYRNKTGKWPDIGELCSQIGVHVTTFYNHCKADHVFKSAWDERLLRGEAKLTSDLHDMKHPIAKLAWLRRHFPERWNPEYKVTAQVDVSFLSALQDKAKAIDAEVVDEKEI